MPDIETIIFYYNSMSLEEPLASEKCSSNSNEKSSPSSSDLSQEERPITCNSLKMDHGDRQDCAQLREELRLKDEQLEQKDQIIKQLQERCMLVVAYEKKIEQLELKACQLQKFLDKLEKDSILPSISKPKEKKSQPDIVECDEYILREQGQSNHIIVTSSKKLLSCENILKQNKDPINKETRKSSIKYKESKIGSQKVQEGKGKQESKGNSAPNQNLNNYEQATSSKCLNPKKTKTEENKHQEIDYKFSKLKESIPVQNKPKSTRNLEEIYSILNSHKSRREELAIKGINQKLETILNQSARLSNHGSPARKNSSQKYTHCPKNQWKTQRDQIWKSLTEERTRGQSFCNSFLGVSKDRSFGDHSRTDRIHPTKSSIFFKPITAASTKKMDNKKFNKILNATTVDEILRARKSTSGLESLNLKNGLNKSSWVFQRTERTKTFWQ